MILTQTIPWANFSDKHKYYIHNALKSRICVAEGAIRSGKTIDHCIIAAARLELCRDRIHLASGSTIGNAKLNIGVCNGFGLEALFRGRCKWGKYRDNEALFLYTQTGEKVVVFAGGGKADSYKRILGNSYGLWIATEINEHYDSDDSRESFIKVAFGRQAAALDPLVLWDLNPCNPNHRIYNDYIDHYAETNLDGYLYEHFTIEDNLSISDKRREEIKAQYDPSSVWYHRDILGERCIAEGLVYPQFREADHVVDEIPRQALQCGEWYISVDYGTANPTAAGLWCLWRGTAYLAREYYYDSRKQENPQRTDEEHYAALEKLAEGCPVRCAVVDPSAASFKATIRRHGKFTALDANNSVLDGIRLTGTLLQGGRLKIHRSCQGLLSEIVQYRWDTDAAEDRVIKECDHAMDQMRYFCATILRREFNWLNWG